MNQLIANTTRSLNLRVIIAILLGLFLVLGMHANFDRDLDREAIDTHDAWPVRISSGKYILLQGFHLKLPS